MLSKAKSRLLSGKTLKLSLLMLLAASVALAQNDDEKLPDSLRFTVRKDYRPDTRDAKKHAVQPELEKDTVTLPEMQYEVLPKEPEIANEMEPMKAVRLGKEPLSKLYNGYLKVGFGNYTMPYAEASFSSLRNKKYQAGGFARYHASFAKLEGKPFGFTDAGVSVFGKYFMKRHVLSADVEYDLDQNYYYGYDPSELQPPKDSINQMFHHVKGTIALRTQQGKKKKIFDFADLSYSHTLDRFKNQEGRASLNGGVVVPIKKSEVQVRSNLDVYHNQSPISGIDDNVIFGLESEFRHRRERWGIDAGFGMFVDGRSTYVKPILTPILRLHYFLAQDMVRFYVNATGGVQRNGLRSISEVNPYAHTDLIRKNSYERLNVKGGFKGNIFRILGFDLSVAEIITQNYMLFVNDTSDGVGLKFTPEYHDIRITRFKGSLSYSLSEKLFVQATAQYRLFHMPNDSVQPWQQAPFTFVFSGNYNLNNKFIFKASITAAGNRVAKGYATDSLGTHVQPIKMNGYADISLGAEYRYKRWIGAFVDLRNIAAMRYEIWNQYPVQRFSFIAGLHFTF
ncbi:MAG: hypothetical protein H6602_13970 [Flavobacteriales bacterium]|nr:hypothetical protein [Flavobacteriales bacterium]